jgi:hypothetical protein
MSKNRVAFILSTSHLPSPLFLTKNTFRVKLDIEDIIIMGQDSLMLAVIPNTILFPNTHRE